MTLKLNPYWRIFIVHWLFVGGGYCVLCWSLAQFSFGDATPHHLIFQFLFFGGGMTLLTTGISKNHLLNKRHAGFPSVAYKHRRKKTVSTDAGLIEILNKLDVHFDTSEAIHRLEKQEIDLLIHRKWYSLGYYFKIYVEENGTVSIAYAYRNFITTRHHKRYEAYADELCGLIQEE